MRSSEVGATFDRLECHRVRRSMLVAMRELAAGELVDRPLPVTMFLELGAIPSPE